MEGGIPSQKAGETPREPGAKGHDRIVNFGGTVERGQASHVFQPVQGIEVHVAAVVSTKPAASDLHFKDAVDHQLGLGKIMSQVLVDRPDVSPTAEPLDVRRNLRT